MKAISTKRNFPEVPKGSGEQIYDWYNDFFSFILEISIKYKRTVVLSHLTSYYLYYY